MTYHDFFHYLFQLNRQLSKQLDQQLTPHGIYRSQWTIIFFLQQKEPVTQAEVCQYLNVEPPTVTRTLTRLAQAGWIKRETGQDKREKKIRLTQKAKKMYPIWKEEVDHFEAQILQNISKQEKQQMMHILQKLNDYVLHKGE